MLLTAALGAITLRFIGLGFGHGVLTARADEELLRSGVLISLTGDLNPHYAVWGHLYHYLYLAVAAAWLAFRVWSGQVPGWIQGVAALHCDPWTFIWLGRAISATAGVLTLFATYRLARRTLGGRMVALGACLLLSVLFLHVRDSHFATCDVLLGLCSTAALAAIAGHPHGVARPALWTGLAIASKLLAATVVLTYVPIILFGKSKDDQPKAWSKRLLQAIRFVLLTMAVAILTQPYLLLDPMETWFGLFGDLFNVERRPFEHGFSLTNAAILGRYYVPQAMGWLIGATAIAGGLRMLRRPKLAREGVIILYLFWFGIAILSVQRIFLRYLVPLLPVICISSAYAMDGLARWVARKWSGRTRLMIAIGATVLMALPNLSRDVMLDHRLLRTDTRELAGQWIEQNITTGNRILWSGYGSIRAHLTMPWLHTPPEYDRRHATLRASRGLSTAVDDAIMEWKQSRGVPTYWIVGLSFGPHPAQRSGLAEYPMLDYDYDFAWLKWLDGVVRAAGIVRSESPRWELMRRHVAGTLEIDPDRLVDSVEPDVAATWDAAKLVVLTGMPVDPNLVALLRESHDEVQVFDPGVPWAEYGGRVMYDMGDAWYLPNYGIASVERPGPQIRIFQKR